MKEKVVLIGSGSAMFTRGLVADIIRRKWDAELALVDINEDALSASRRLTSKMIKAENAPIKLSASTNRRDVLGGATVVISTIGVGGRRSREQDVFIPRKYGIYQTVGDTVMPGGAARALRMIPAMTAIAEDVLDLAPDALFFNYANPMAVVCRAVRKATNANMIGLCHGVFDFSKYIAKICGLSHSELNYTVVGINHLSWIVSADVKGESIMPKLHQIAEDKLSQKNINDVSELEEENLFTWELVRAFGFCPVPGDRHVSEFFPTLFQDGRYYDRQLGVDVFKFEKAIALGDRIYNEMCEEGYSDRPIQKSFFEYLNGEHEQVIDIIDSIRKDTGNIYSANLPNTGQVPNLPMDAIVESPTIVDKNGIKAILQKPLDEVLARILINKYTWVETIVEAALTGSRKKFIQALIIDGSVNSIEKATKLADEFLATQAKYLPQFNKVPKPEVSA